MNQEDDHNLIEVVKTPSPDSIPNEDGEWTWENTPVLPTDGVPGNGGPQSPQPPQGPSSPGSTISSNNSSTAVTLSLGTPSPWETLETLSFINTRDREVVKLDASFMLSWTSVSAAHTFIGIDYRILRNGTQIYLSSNAFGSEEQANAKNSEHVSCFHIDSPNVGNYNYTLQIRINLYTNLQPTVQIVQSELAAVVYSGILSKSSLYVSYTENLEAPNDPGFVAVVDPDNKKVIKTIRVGRSPGALAKSPDGASVYGVNVQDGTVSIIDTNPHTVAATLPVGNSPAAVIVAPNNTKAYVANYGSQNVTIIDLFTKIVVSPDYSRICISIEANDSDLHFIEIPVAHKSVITSYSSLAYVMENSYVHPVDIIHFKPFESIYIGGKILDMVAAYQMTT